jgi:hypothetical protein
MVAGLSRIGPHDGQQPCWGMKEKAVRQLSHHPPSNLAYRAGESGISIVLRGVGGSSVAVAVGRTPLARAETSPPFGACDAVPAIANDVPGHLADSAASVEGLAGLRV